MKSLVSLFLCCNSLAFAQTAPASGPAKLVKSSNSKFTYEVFDAPAPAATLILLHGSSPDLPVYREQATYFANQGYRVLFPHYFDASRSTSPTTQNYQVWVDVVKELVSEIATPATHSEKPQPIFIVGYSLGASVALAAGSELVPVSAIADFYGSLPDDFFLHMQGMTPLLILHGQRDTNIPVMNAEQLIRLCTIKQLTCDHHIYPDQSHGFSPEALTDADKRTLAFFDQITHRN